VIPIRRAGKGFSFIMDGLRLIRQDGELLRWAAVPFVIDLLLVVIGFFAGAVLMPGWVQAAVAMVIPASAGLAFSILYYPLLLFFWLVFLILWIYVIFLFATVIAAPFNTVLAERTLMKAGVIASRPFNFTQWSATSFRMMITALVKATVFLLLGVGIFALSFVPVVNLLSSFLALQVMAFDSFDCSFEILEMNFRERMKVFRQMFPEATGMAGALAVSLMVPGLTLLLMPAAIVGSASMLKGVPNLGRK